MRALLEAALGLGAQSPAGFLEKQGQRLGPSLERQHLPQPRGAPPGVVRNQCTDYVRYGKAKVTEVDCRQTG